MVLQMQMKFHCIIILSLQFLIISVDNGVNGAAWNKLSRRHPQCMDGDFGCSCEGRNDCDKSKYLECIDGHCDCEYPERRKYDMSMGHCVSLVGSFCDKDDGKEDWHPDCVRNAECMRGRCVCVDGYSKTNKNTCLVGYGKKCKPKQCNGDVGLACKDGTCKCADASFIYSRIHQECVDPEAEVKNFIESVAERVIRSLISLKMRGIMMMRMMPQSNCMSTKKKGKGKGSKGSKGCR